MSPIFKRGLPARLIRFKVGQRVRIVGSDPPRFGSITEVIEGRRRARYRVNRDRYLWFEYDLAEAPVDRWGRDRDLDNPQPRPGESPTEFTGRMLGERRDI